jgi:predicted kinase
VTRKLECVILIGLPASGKTLLYRQRFARTHVQVSKDLWSGTAKRDRRQRELIGDSLGSNRSVVVDNTNPTAADRAVIIALARAAGARVIGYFFDVSTRAAVARNREREAGAKVPDVAIFTAAKRLQPPSKAEGFDELWRVTLAPDHSLKVASFF